MTSSNGNIFSVTGPLCGEFTGLRWIPLTKASNAELWHDVFFDLHPNKRLSKNLQSLTLVLREHDFSYQCPKN